VTEITAVQIIERYTYCFVRANKLSYLEILLYNSCEHDFYRKISRSKDLWERKRSFSSVMIPVFI